MKNLNTIIVSLSLLILLSACQKNETIYNDNQTRTKLLYSDPDFKVLIMQEMELKEKLNTIGLENKLSIKTLDSTINAIRNNSENKDELKYRLNTELSPKLFEFLVEFSNTNQQAWIHLNKKFSNLSAATINDACAKYFDQKTIMEINNENKITSNSLTIKSNASCGWGYNLCIAGTTAGAILCHAGCVGATAGLGAPACVLLCGTIQIAAGAQCMTSYCNFNQ